MVVDIIDVHICAYLLTYSPQICTDVNTEWAPLNVRHDYVVNYSPLVQRAGATEICKECTLR